MEISESLYTLLAFLFGAILAAVANYLADRWGWTLRYRSPWRRFARVDLKTSYPKRAFFDYIPIVGQLALARFALKRPTLKGRAVDYSTIPGWESRYFWLRGFATEALFAILLVMRWLYWREALGVPDAVAIWLVESSFFWFLLVASLIDLDDYIIPDVVTIVGTLTALAVAYFGARFVLIVPTDFPNDWHMASTTPFFTEWISTLASRLLGFSSSIVTIAPFFLIWTFWCFALLDRRFYLRLGLRRALALFWRRLFRSRLTIYVGVIWALGLCALYWISRSDLDALNSFVAVNTLALALIGLFFGVVLIWTVRLVGGTALGMEAMGFGDVILAGVIGAYLGWQGVLVVFFIAPFFGLFFGLLRRGFQADREIPYGPFLALGSLVYMVWREKFNELLAPLFGDLVFLATLGGGGLALFVILLTALRIVRELRAR